MDRRGARKFDRKPRRDKDLRSRMVEYSPPNRRTRPMEAEQLNQIATTLADLASRSTEMRRYL
jgi:hypothetical protein